MHKSRNPFLAIAVLALLAACNSSPKTQDYSAQLLRINNQYDSALLRGDTVALGKLFAPDFTLVNPDGRLLNRQEQLLNVATSELKWESAHSENVSVRVYGNTAILLGEFRGTGSYRGNQLTVHERYTTCWIKTDTSWQLTAEHANLVR